MPTYTYACTGCGHHFDLFHSMSDNSVKACPECGAEAKRQIGAGVGLIFKGTGFYITDYKNGHASPPSNGDSSNGHNGHNGHDGNKEQKDQSSPTVREESSSKNSSAKEKPAAESTPAAKPKEASTEK